MKVPRDESSTYGTFVPGNESSRVQKFHESYKNKQPATTPYVATC